eukprot:evm.model.scf_136.6 EVM.evm.TU.scf_136.6   scf_136:115212-116312(+)
MAVSQRPRKSSRPSSAEQKKLDRDLWDAARDGDISKVTEALEEGADFNVVGRTAWGDAMPPVSVAAFYGHLDAVEALVMAGSGTDRPSEFGSTALMYAAYEAQLPVVRFLLKVGADVNKGSSGGAIFQEGLAPVHVASRKPGPQSVLVMKALLDAGADIDALDAYQYGPLAYSAYWGNPFTARVLIERGASAIGTHPSSVICGCNGRVLAVGDPGPKCEAGGCDNPEVLAALFLLFIG